MIVINLFGGPGTGKSTNAAGLFTLMKRKYYNVELIQERAKEIVYEGNLELLADQETLLKQQNHRQERLKNAVDFAITDSPLLMATTYIPKGYNLRGVNEVVMKKQITDAFHSYNNFNFFLTRIKRYVPIGRTQTEDEAIEKDKQILNMLNSEGIEYHTVVAGHYCPESILEIIEHAIERDMKASNTKTGNICL